MGGYISRAAQEYANVEYDALLYCKTNIGGYFFDGFLDVQHSSELQITSNPVETGAAIVDHSYLEPRTVRMTVLVSDVHQSLVEGQFSNGWARHTAAWRVLKQMQEDRLPVTVFTKLGLYDNMLIQRLDATDSKDTINMLRANVTLQEVPVATLKTVRITEADQTVLDAELGRVALQYMTDNDYSTLWGIFYGGKQ